MSTTIPRAMHCSLFPLMLQLTQSASYLRKLIAIALHESVLLYCKGQNFHPLYLFLLFTSTSYTVTSLPTPLYASHSPFVLLQLTLPTLPRLLCCLYPPFFFFGLYDWVLLLVQHSLHLFSHTASPAYVGTVTVCTFVTVKHNSTLPICSFALLILHYPPSFKADSFYSVLSAQCQRLFQVCFSQGNWHLHW